MSLNSYQLKYIALVSMIIDHIGIAFRQDLSNDVYVTMRSVGRLSFPIFCFLLVEGFTHTRNRNKYVTRLLLFSILSEIPFDLALRGCYTNIHQHVNLLKLMDWSSQNVFFTLSIGFLAMMTLEHFPSQKNSFYCVLIFFPCLAEFIHSDYGAIGVLTVLLFYLYQKYDHIALWSCLIPLLLLSIGSWMQVFSIFSLYFINAYNGQKGRGIKYLFYIAYPAHLLLLCVIRTII